MISITFLTMLIPALMLSTISKRSLYLSVLAYEELSIHHIVIANISTVKLDHYHIKPINIHRSIKIQSLQNPLLSKILDNYYYINNNLDTFHKFLVI